MVRAVTFSVTIPGYLLGKGLGKLTESTVFGGSLVLPYLTLIQIVNLRSLFEVNHVVSPQVPAQLPHNTCLKEI